MYETAFGLTRRPFAATPDASCFYAPEPIRELLDQLMHRIEQGQGISVLTGAAGTGKTLICRRLVQELQGPYAIAYLSSAGFSTRRALLQAILYEVGQRYAGLGEQELRLELRSFLKRLVASQRALVLVIDEAHLLDEKLLEEIRLVANLSENGQSPVRVMLAGQVVLEEVLARPAQAALSQIITCQLLLETLTISQSREYIACRIAWAAGDASRLFAADALEAVVQASGGLPRCLNQLCDHSLLLALVAESARVERVHVEAALSDLKQLPLHWNETLSPSAEALLESRGETTPITPLPDAFSIEIGGLDGGAGAFNESSRIEFDAPRIDDNQNPLDSADTEVLVSSTSDDYELLTSGQTPRQHASEWRITGGGGDGGGVVPLSAGSRKPIGLVEEELVVDRYAQLDSSRAIRVLAPAPQAAKAMDGFHCDDDEPLVCNEVLGLPGDLPMEDDVIPLAGELIDAAPPTAATFDIEGFRPEGRPLEERLETEIYDICLQVQQSILDRLAPLTTEAAPETDADAPVYDAVEPELCTPVQERIQHIDPATTGGAAVPPPNYKLIFSTLRKKLGKK